jgi:putative PIN family toxin of toxin-antitoxin system
VTPLQLVLDTNTVIPALFFRREKWTWLKQSWKMARIVPLLCNATTLELMTVLNYPKFHLAKEDQTLIMAEILPFVKVCPDPSPSENLPPCRDPKDQIFLQLAWVSKAQYLVTGDKDLWEYQAPEGLTILTPATLKNRLNPQ